MKEGDIFFWRYKDETSRSYHCKSRIAIVTDGKLCDTFWGHSGDRRIVDPNEVDLEYKANMAELTPRSPSVMYRYADEDIVDLRHSNGGTFYVKTGAQASCDKILAHIKEQREEYESQIRVAKWKLEQLDSAQREVEAGNLVHV